MSWLIVPYLAFAGLAYFVCGQSNAETVAVVLTGIVVILYTEETRKLRVQAELQIEASQTPFVIFQMAEVPVLCNLGPGHAVNIRVNPIQVAPNVVLEFERIAILEAGSRKELVNSPGSPLGWMPHLDPSFANQDLPVQIIFRSLGNLEYSVRQTIRPNKNEIHAIERTRELKVRR